MTRVACIDIGTLTCRLAMASVESGRVTHLTKASTICNLGEGVAATGRLSDGAVDRVSACVRAYLAEVAQGEVAGICCTLTSAARDAVNATSLTDVLVSLGLRPHVIPGDVEGALTFVGVASDHPGTPLIVADSGGGSTELAAGTMDPSRGARIAYVRSVDVGCRRVTDRFLSDDAPDTAEQLAAAHGFARRTLADAARRAREAAGDGALLVACGGTVTSLVAMRDDIVPYDSSRVHGATLSAREVATLEARLAALDVAGRAQVRALQAQRAPVIVGGAVTVAELLRTTGLPSLTVSEHDLLFGLALAAAAALDGTAPPVPWVPKMAVVA